MLKCNCPASKRIALYLNVWFPRPDGNLLDGVVPGMLDRLRPETETKFIFQSTDWAGAQLERKLFAQQYTLTIWTFHYFISLNIHAAQTRIYTIRKRKQNGSKQTYFRLTSFAPNEILTQG